MTNSGLPEAVVSGINQSEPATELPASSGIRVVVDARLPNPRDLLAAALGITEKATEFEDVGISRTVDCQYTPSIRAADSKRDVAVRIANADQTVARRPTDQRVGANA